MSKLNTVFDIIAGIAPHDQTSVELNLPKHSSVNGEITAGMIVKIAAESNGAPAFNLLTSGGTTGDPDFPWVVAVGSDFSDASVSGKLTAYAALPGLIVKIPTNVSFNVGDFVCADNGLIAKTVDKQYFGQIIETNSVDKWVVVACGR